ncbi:MAG: hypothetical protein HFE94_08060 [Acutalibacter sp.]|nr:hypothetical protein [Acutalibacter sp.]
MRKIETDIWVPNEEKKGWVKYAGQRKVREVWEELCTTLKEEGVYPPEYFLLERDFENRELFPKLADVYCFTRWGSNEGIYIDVNMLISDEEEKKYKQIHFATGKSLGETEEEFDRMNYIAGYIYRLFMGNGSIHARYMLVPGKESQITHKKLLKRAEYEAVAQMKQRMFLANSVGLTRPIGDYADELAVKLMIVKAMQNFELPEDKLIELAKQENILDVIYPLCRKVMEPSLFEIEDLLASCKSLLKKGGAI